LRTHSTLSGPRRAARAALTLSCAALAALALGACGSDEESSDSAGGGGDKFKIALIQSYSGNDWQNASANLVKALASTPPYKDEVEFDHQIAGTDPQKQSKLITDEVSAGADALVIYPISPTAINTAVKKACDQGVIVVNYDSWTEEPCSYNVHVDVQKLAKARADWLAEHLGGEGKIAEIIGVAGTAFDTIHQKAVDEALKAHPGIELAAREEGFWAQPGARDAITKIISAHPDLDGYIAQVGCWGATQKLLSMNKEMLPCAGDVSMGHLRMMLKKGSTAGAIGLPSVAGSETTFTGALAFLQAYNMLKGGDDAKEQRCHETIIDPIVYANEDLKVGDDPKRIGNVYPEDHVPSVPPGFFANFYSPLVGQGLNASLSGTSDQLEKPVAPEKTGGDDTVDGIADEQDACLVP
jgi:ribose transport system substrate-binding protein